MSEDDIEVEEVPEVGFNEVEFEEIKVGFENVHEAEELPEELTDSPRDDSGDSDDLKEFLGLGFLADVFGFEHTKGLSLEETLAEVVVKGVVREEDEKLGNDDSYEVRDDVYDGSLGSEAKEDEPGVGYDGFVDMDDVNTFVGSEVGRQGNRSVLEIAGFRDEEAEKKRKEKAERFW